MGLLKLTMTLFFKDHGLGDPFSGWNWLLFKIPKPTFYDKVIFKIDQLFKICPTQPKDQPPLYYQKDQDQGDFFIMLMEPLFPITEAFLDQVIFYFCGIFLRSNFPKPRSRWQEFFIKIKLLYNDFYFQQSGDFSFFARPFFLI